MNLLNLSLQLLLPLFLVTATVALCVKYLRGPTRRRALAALGLALGAPVAYHGYYLVGPGRYAEFEDIQDRLRQLPGVELLDATGHEDVTFEIGGFTIDVEDRGVIAFGALDRRSFEHTDHLPLLSIGGIEVIVVMEGYLGVYRASTGEPVRSKGWGYGMDVGPKGPFARFFPFSLSRVQDVLEHYEEICAELVELADPTRVRDLRRREGHALLLCPEGSLVGRRLDLPLGAGRGVERGARQVETASAAGPPRSEVSPRLLEGIDDTHALGLVEQPLRQSLEPTLRLPVVPAELFPVDPRGRVEPL